jgi:acetamidase/formamidase
LFPLTAAADSSLEEYSGVAARKKHRFLQEHCALSDAQSALLPSLTGNLRICQVFDPDKSCSMEFPIGLPKE